VLSAGQTFARYVIEAPIGEGGMGEVYRAFDQKLRRKVALKVLHPDLAVPDAAARLVREARAAAALAHPNTIAIYDLGEIDGTVFLVMELISGASLRAYVGDTTVPVAQKLRWLADIARGLGAAHKAGLVHRDVKPTNVMVSDEGVVKVLDFGLAKPLEAASFHTDAGLVVGTPRYMAPELFTGMRADARSDQYAFGVTAYELLAGVHPGGITGPVPAALDTLVPEVGPAVARIIARTLSRSAAERYAGMNEIAAALEERITTTRASEIREPSPATRREGVAPAPDAALALAATELPPSAEARSGARPERHVATSGRGDLATSGRARGDDRSRGSNAFRNVAVFGMVAMAGGYGAMRFFGVGPGLVSGVSPSASPSASSAASVDADSFDGAFDGQVAPAPDLVTGAASNAASDGAIDRLDDAAAQGDAAPEAAARTIQIEDFQDPWAKQHR
jgi:serine/threonine-protein kinase